jgi:hypothetical protein
MKAFALLCLFFVLLNHLEADTRSGIYGTYPGKASVESGTSTDNFKAKVQVVETSATLTTARITFKPYSTLYEQILRFREDGSIYGVVRFDGEKVATLKGTWVLEENRYRYRGTIRVGKDDRTAIAGFLNFYDGSRLTATGRLPGNEKFRFSGTKY